MPTSSSRLTVAMGRVVRDLRLQASLSQEALGYKAGLSRNYISELELGQKSPTLPTIEALARAFGLKPHVLVQQAEEQG